MSREEALDIVGMLKSWCPVEDKEAADARVKLVKAATEKLLEKDND